MYLNKAFFKNTIPLHRYTIKLLHKNNTLLSKHTKIYNRIVHKCHIYYNENKTNQYITLNGTLSNFSRFLVKFNKEDYISNLRIMSCE